MAFDHQADNRLVALDDLVGHVLHHQRLQGRVFIGVGVAAVDHDVRADFRLVQCLLAERNADRIIVRLAVATAQYHVAVGVTLGGHDRHAAFLVDTQEAMRAGNRLQGVDRNGQAAIGAVFEAYRRRQARGHFAVGLRLGGASANGRPADQVLQVLRGDRIEGFGGRWQAHFSQIQQQLTADMQAVLDLERVVQVRVVDQAFPAYGGAWLFKINAHDQIQRIADFCGEHFQTLGILVGSLDIVDRARPDDNEQSMVSAIQDVANHLASFGHRLQSSFTQRHFALELFRCDQGFVGGNV